MSTPLPSLEPRRLLRDRAANALLWCAGVGVILAPGAVVTMALVALFSTQPGPCLLPAVTSDSCNRCTTKPNGTMECTAMFCGDTGTISLGYSHCDATTGECW